jgi:transposase
MTSRPYSRSCRTASIRSGIAGGLAGELEREFEPTAQTIRNWVAQADRDEGRVRTG